MRALIAITRETMLRLRRDRIFVPALVAAILLSIMASVVSDWGVEEFRKILFDIGMAGLHMTGGMVAIFWGAKLISDSKQEGSLEVQLASPVSRTAWIVGKFVGLCLSLVLLGVLFTVFWQAVMYATGFGAMTAKHVVIIAMLAFIWIILGAVVIFFASFTSYSVALFAAICFWLAGLVSGPIAGTLMPTTPPFTRALVSLAARFWNLQRFNLSQYASMDEFPSQHELTVTAGYGVAVIGLLLTLAAIIFRKRDLVG